MASEEAPKKRVKKDNELSAAARTMGRVAGKKGGPARDKALDHETKVKIAREGGLASAAARKAKSKSVKAKLKKPKPKKDS